MAFDGKEICDGWKDGDDSLFLVCWVRERSETWPCDADLCDVDLCADDDPWNLSSYSPHSTQRQSPRLRHYPSAATISPVHSRRH